MTEKQTFSALVRAVGLLVLLRDSAREFWFMIVRWAFPATVFHTTFNQDFIYAVLSAILGFVLIRWPEVIVRIAWPDESDRIKLNQCPK